MVDFEDTISKFVAHLRDLFGSHARDDHRSWRSRVFFPSRIRNVILVGGHRQTLLKIVYGGHERLVEPYSLRFKRLKDGTAFEYFYAFDRSGGGSGSLGIKSLVPDKFELAENTDTPFEPRYPIDVSKAGDSSQAGSFGGRHYVPGFGLTRRSAAKGPLYVFRCTGCRRVFAHRSFENALRKHKNARGGSCYGSFGTYVETRW